MSLFVFYIKTSGSHINEPTITMTQRADLSCKIRVWPCGLGLAFLCKYSSMIKYVLRSPLTIENVY